MCLYGALPRVARAALHRWEEPCVSGSRGSGAVFFSGCSLRCVYCQNSEISLGTVGQEITVSRLRELYARLIDEGAHNINLVNPTHFALAVAESLDKPLSVPVIWNSSGYERAETLKLLDGRVSVYMPDFKYALARPAALYSNAPDYPRVAKTAIARMYRQTGDYSLNADGLITHGIIVRHLILPGQLTNTRRVIDWFARSFAPGQALFSLMSQYFPAGRAADFPEINRAVTPEEHRAAAEYLEKSGIEDGFFQDPPGDEPAYVPEWDFLG
jgi:putative pyruvate formate lyase activating enzyme